ncbi:MAG: hypothetical protein U0S36_02130 [Candidatus Nanopelagicales bacterium]|jgi:hypothetical protein
MSDHHATAVAVRVVALPLLGVLGAVAMVRDEAARLRVREDDLGRALPQAWDRLTATQRARLVEDPGPQL